MKEAKPPHRIAVRVLIALGTFLTVLAIVAVWTERQALDTNEWVDTSGKLLEDDAIKESLSAYLTDQLFAAVDVQAKLDKRLPPDLKPLAGPVAGGLRQFAGTASRDALDNPRVQSAWRKANRTAHELLLNIVEEKGRFANGADATVNLELRPIVAQLGEQIGIGSGVADKLPEKTATLKILDTRQLETARTIVRWIHGLAIILSLAALACFALAIFLSKGRRQVTVLWCGVGLIVAGIAVLALRHMGGNYVVNNLVTDDSATTAAHNAWSIGTSLMTGIARTVIVYGFLFIIASWLASPTSSAQATRRVLAPSLRDRPGLVFGLLVAAALIYLALAPTSGLRSLLTITFLAALAAVGLQALRRQTAEEFPDARAGDTTARLKGFAGRVRSGVSDRVGGRAPRTGRTAPKLTAKEAGEERRMEQLERLGELRERGVLTKKEFDEEKKRVLAGE